MLFPATKIGSGSKVLFVSYIEFNYRKMLSFNILGLLLVLYIMCIPIHSAVEMRLIRRVSQKQQLLESGKWKEHLESKQRLRNDHLLQNFFTGTGYQIVSSRQNSLKSFLFL